MNRRGFLRRVSGILLALALVGRKAKGKLIPPRPVKPEIGQIWLVSEDTPREWAGKIMILHSRDQGCEGPWGLLVKNELKKSWMRTPGIEWWCATIHTLSHERDKERGMMVYGGARSYLHATEELLAGIQGNWPGAGARTPWRYLGNIGEFLSRANL